MTGTVRRAVFPEYEYELGSPTGAYSKDSSGVYERKFRSGLVVVNPSTRSVTVDFNAAYSGSGLSNAKEAKLAPHSGLVLVRAGSAAAASIARASAPGSGFASARVRHRQLQQDRRHRRHRRHRHRHMHKHNRRHSRRRA